MFSIVFFPSHILSPCRKVVEADPSAEVTLRFPLSSRTANPDEPEAGGRLLASRPVAPVVKASRLRLASSRTLRYSCEETFKDDIGQKLFSTISYAGIEGEVNSALVTKKVYQFIREASAHQTISPSASGNRFTRKLLLLFRPPLKSRAIVWYMEYFPVRFSHTACIFTIRPGTHVCVCVYGQTTTISYIPRP